MNSIDNQTVIYDTRDSKRYEKEGNVDFMVVFSTSDYPQLNYPPHIAISVAELKSWKDVTIRATGTIYFQAPIEDLDVNLTAEAVHGVVFQNIFQTTGRLHILSEDGKIMTQSYDKWGPNKELKQCVASIEIQKRCFGDNDPAIFQVKVAGEIELKGITALEKNIEVHTPLSVSIEGKICKEIQGHVGKNLHVALEDKIQVSQFKNLVVKGKKTLQLLLKDGGEGFDEF